MTVDSRGQGIWFCAKSAGATILSVDQRFDIFRRWSVCANTFMVVIVLMLLGPMFAGTTAAGTIEVELEFNENDLELSRVDGFDLVRIRADKSSVQGQPGHPLLAVRDVHILIPPGCKVSRISAVAANQVELPGRHTIYPAQPAVPVSAGKSGRFVGPDRAVYASRTGLADKVAELVDTVIIRGYHVAVVRVYPLDYVPAEGKLILRNKIRISLETDKRPRRGRGAVDERVRYKSQKRIFKEFVEASVVNPQALAEYSTSKSFESLDVQGAGFEVPPDGNDVDYLVICASSMVDEFEPLLEWKTMKGIPAEAVDVDWIYPNYSGVDSQERIKACIKDYVQNKGTVWVVLAGDDSIVPDRDCYGYVPTAGESDKTIPTDLYYAGLDDMNWNDDADDKCGEVGDDTIDMGADVYVGRLPIRTEADAAVVVSKILQYERDLLPTGFAEKMLLSGVELWDPGDAEQKSETMYSTHIDPYWVPVRDRFYDTFTDFPGGASYDVTDVHLNDQLANGYNFLHMATHGNKTYWPMETGSYSTADAFNASNAGKYVNIVTIACWANAFDGADLCLSEALIRNAGGGAISYIGSSRYGWGVSGTSLGSSFQYDRTFYQFLFTGDPGSYPQRLGAVYTRMKESKIASCGSYGSMRWLQFSINLMGDPEMCLYTYDPQTFSPSYDAEIDVTSQTFTVDAGVGGVFVCLWKPGEVYVYGSTNPSGRFTADIEPLSSGAMYVTITKPNYYPHEGRVIVGSSFAGDFEPKDGDVDVNDLEFFSSQWLKTDCASGNDWCGGADFEPDNDVDFDDYCVFAENWQAGVWP